MPIIDVIAIAMACLDAFMAAFNARDLIAIQTTVVKTEGSVRVCQRWTIKTRSHPPVLPPR